MEKTSDLWTGSALPASSFRIASQVCAAIVMCIGAGVLVGWALDVPALKSIFQGAVEMKVNTALGLVLSACALLAVASRRMTWVSDPIALVVVTMGVGTLSQYMFGWDLRIDEFFIDDTGQAYNAARGRMSPYTAASFVALGLAIFAVTNFWTGPLLWAACSFPIGVGAVSIIGYLWGAQEIVTDTIAPPVAVHTAFGIIILGVGLLTTAVARRTKLPRSGFRNPASIESRVLTSLVGGLVILFLGAGYIYREEASSGDTADGLQNHRLVNQTLRDLYAESTDAQSALRAYVFTNDPQYRDAYRARVTDAKSAESTLKALLEGNSTQSAAIAELDNLLRDRLQTMTRVAAAHEQGRPDLVQEEMKKGRTLEVAAAMKETIANIEALEAAELHGQRRLIDRSRQMTLLALLTVLAGSTSIAVLVLRGIRKEIAARQATEQELRAVHAQSEKRHMELERSHRQLEAQARDILIANQFLDSVVENLPHMVFVKDAGSLRFVRLNRAGYDLLGFSKEDLIGKNDGDFFPKGEADAFNERDRAVLASGQASDVAREVIHTKNRGQRVLHTVKIPILGTDGKPLYLLGLSEDITEAEEKQREILRLNEELKLLAVEATSANRAKGNFLATMSHEIRTPMNGMLGMLELLSMTDLNADQKATLGVVQNSSISLLRIINDILDFSKMEAGKLDIRPEPCNLHKLVEEVQSMHAGAASSKGLRITGQVDPRISTALMVDPLRLQQILNNFTTNAIKFTLEGSVELAATLIERSEAGETIEVSVTDTGIGISQEDQERLFEPFNQGPAETAQRFGGTGLGLSICRRLADMMGASVVLQSVLGHGTRMSLTLRLPLAGANDLVQAMPQVASTQAFALPGGEVPSVDEAEAAGTLVLVVDDHPTNRMLIAKQLFALGIACEMASDGVEAMQVWASRKFALILTDCQMPNMNGYQLARKIREAESGTGRRVPIIACTANALGDESQICLAAGMDDLLVKPIDLRDLGGKLRQWLPVESVRSPPVAAAALAPAPAAAIDLARVAATWGGTETTLEILAFFRVVNDKDAEALQAAAASGEMLQAADAAHRMVGAGKMVGANDFALACEAVEAAGRASDPGRMSVAMAKFKSELGRLNQELDALKIAQQGA